MVCGKGFVTDGRHEDAEGEEKDNRCKACQAPKPSVSVAATVRRSDDTRPTKEIRLRCSYGAFTVHLMRPNGFTVGRLSC